MRSSLIYLALCGASPVFGIALPSLVDHSVETFGKRAAALSLEAVGLFRAVTLDDALSITTAEDESINTEAVDETDNFDTKGFAAAASATCTNPHVRFEWRDYSDTDRKAFVDGIYCLMQLPSSGGHEPSQSRYEDLVRVHQAATGTVHGNRKFLLWHRYFTWTFEQMMREECGFDRAFPWWDETLDAGAFAQSTVFSNDYFGNLPTATNGSWGTCVSTGKFAGITLHIGPGSGNQDHCLSRAVNEEYTSQSNAAYVSQCNSRTTFNDMAKCAETGPHAWGHNGIGSVMSDVSASPSDPVFFLHHLFVDRDFAAWQNAANSTTRKSSVDGCADGNNPCTALALDTVLDMGGLRPNVTVADVIDTENGVLCYKYTY